MRNSRFCKRYLALVHRLFKRPLHRYGEGLLFTVEFKKSQKLMLLRLL